jgi:hypothetical protein
VKAEGGCEETILADLERELESIKQELHTEKERLTRDYCCRAARRRDSAVGEIPEQPRKQKSEVAPLHETSNESMMHLRT